MQGRKARLGCRAHGKPREIPAMLAAWLFKGTGAVSGQTRNNYGIGEPIPLRLNDANMLRSIRLLAEDSLNVFIEPHARQQMKRRKITRTQVIACLQHGAMFESAHENIRGNWKCTLRHHHAGDLVRVAAAVERDENGDWIAVVTVF